MRPCGGVAEGLPAPLLVLGEVSAEEGDLAVALEGEHVGRDAVEEPAVVGDDDDTSGELIERVLERAQGVDVNLQLAVGDETTLAARLLAIGGKLNRAVLVKSDQTSRPNFMPATDDGWPLWL